MKQVKKPYNLNEDCKHTLQEVFDYIKLSSSLDRSKEVVKQWMRSNYDFKKRNIERYFQNVDSVNTVNELFIYLFNSTNKGYVTKMRINNNY